MGIHHQTHPEYIEGCFACKAGSVAVAPSATPTRSGGAEAARINAKEKEWAKDHRAYRNLVKDGLQPDMLDGAARFEQQANDALEIERGQLATPTQVAAVKEAEAEMRELST